MAIMRVHKNNNYTIMSNYHFKEKEMSLKAKGLLSLMLSLPDNWDYSIKGLVALSKDGKDSVMKALKELEDFKYLKRTRLQRKNGKFKGYDYDIFEEPYNMDLLQKSQPSSEKPYSDKPYSEKPHTVNPLQLNTNNINNTKILRTNTNKDIKDKKINNDKERKDVDFLISQNLKPNKLTKLLISCKYIQKDDLNICDFNEYIDYLIKSYDFKLVKTCVKYFTERNKYSRAVDENGEIIKNKLSYFKKSMQSNVNKFNGITTKTPSDLLLDWEKLLKTNKTL